MREYTFTGIIGDNTEVDLKCEYSPAQKEILYPAESSQEGFPAELSVYAVLIGKDDIKPDLKKETIERLEESAWEQYNGLGL